MERRAGQTGDHQLCGEGAERIATFDNDGTLWSEQPVPVQLNFALDRVKALASQHPEWKTQEPFASLLKGDLKSALAGGDRAILALFMATHTGMTADEFEQIVKDWIATARNPKNGRLYTEMVYQPMLEVLAYLRANGFKTFIVSGGGIEFMRPWAERVYGIPPPLDRTAPASARTTRTTGSFGSAWSTSSARYGRRTRTPIPSGCTRGRSTSGRRRLCPRPCPRSSPQSRNGVHSGSFGANRRRTCRSGRLTVTIACLTALLFIAGRWVVYPRDIT